MAPRPPPVSSRASRRGPGGVQAQGTGSLPSQSYPKVPWPILASFSYLVTSSQKGHSTESYCFAMAAPRAPPPLPAAAAAAAPAPGPAAVLQAPPRPRHFRLHGHFRPRGADPASSVRRPPPGPLGLVVPGRPGGTGAAEAPPPPPLPPPPPPPLLAATPIGGAGSRGAGAGARGGASRCIGPGRRCCRSRCRSGARSRASRSVLLLLLRRRRLRRAALGGEREGGASPKPRPGGSLAGPGPGAAGRGGETGRADKEAAQEPGRGRVIKGEVPGPCPPLPLRPPPPFSLPPSAAAPAAAARPLSAGGPQRVTTRGPSSAFRGGARTRHLAAGRLVACLSLPPQASCRREPLSPQLGVPPPHHG